MSPLISRKRSFSSMAGGGVHGKVAGIVRGIIMQVGTIISMCPRSTATYRETGGIITGKIDGGAMPGKWNDYHPIMSKTTGGTGNTTGIGSGRDIGVLKTGVTTGPNCDGHGGKTVAMTDAMTDATAGITVAMIGQVGRPGLSRVR